ncbi:MAG TPA: hypothetical protein VNZ47_15760 [Candidatus Dormibacteraeota bacterium]|nr:hypothetical protein [Candidatus Dormibacteraeota bacterium]
MNLLFALAFEACAPKRVLEGPAAVDAPLPWVAPANPGKADAPATPGMRATINSGADTATFGSSGGAQRQPKIVQPPFSA